MTQLATRMSNSVRQRTHRGLLSSGWIDARLEALEPRFVLSSSGAGENAPIVRPNWDPAAIAKLALPVGNERATSLADGQFGGVVGRFKGPLPADQYAAPINWGDGSTSQGIITQDADGTIVVSGIHDYTDAHHHWATTALLAPPGSEPADIFALGVSKDIVTFAEPMLIDWASAPPTDSPTHLALGGLYDVEPHSASDYTLQIDWGDGTKSSGQIVRMDGGGFELYGDHAYDDFVHAHIILTVTRSDGKTIQRSAIMRAYPDAPYYFLEGSEFGLFYYERGPDVSAPEVIPVGSDGKQPAIDRRFFPAPTVEAPTTTTNRPSPASTRFEQTLSTSDKDPLFGDQSESLLA